MPYRLDVEGLRAVAVVLVVLFHINERWIPGGFVGVDMFFVISGFVITLWMKRAIEGDSFSLIEFYRRRFKRILPAMFVVVFVSLVVGVFTMLPSDLTSLSWSAIFSILSAANIYFTYFIDTSYFAEDSKGVPLLHLWSLGIEEQFYLVWPILMLVLMRLKRALVSSLTILIAGSALYGQYLLSADNFSFAYYMLPSRMFQLATGGLLVFLPVITKPLLAEILSFTGVILVASSAYWLTGVSPFPGLNAVPLTLGTSLVIYSGSQRTVLARVLSLTPMLWTGKRSYSIYLWHWPVLAFQHYLFSDLTLIQQIASLFLTFILGHLSYQYVEERTRYSKATLWGVTKTLVIPPTAVIVALCAWLITTKGMWPYGAGFTAVEAIAAELTLPVADVKEVCIPRVTGEKEFSDPRCILATNGEAHSRVLLWGDSNAAHYVGTINEVAKAAGVSVQNISHSACPPLLEKASEFAHPVYRDWCAKSVPYIVSRLKDYDTIILGGQWGTYFSRGDFKTEMDKTISALSDSHRKVIVLGQVPAFSGYDRKCFLKQYKVPFIQCEAIPRLINGNQDDKKMFTELAKKYPNVTYVDMFPFLCQNGKCSPYADHKPLYTNGTHLGYGGSVDLGKRIGSELKTILE
ncbi:acyltransferase family protein [Brucella cytisi]|uniref:acyltransferase family protein n=1 Tax=Brucella cytisi TaxID=407152 RepID=UPI00142DF363|nr:acyltransferase family protein [Brucella cytisi]